MFLPLFLNQVLDFISAYFFDVVYVKEMFVIPCEQLKIVYWTLLLLDSW